MFFCKIFPLLRGPYPRAGILPEGHPGKPHAIMRLHLSELLPRQLTLDRQSPHIPPRDRRRRPDR